MKSGPYGNEQLTLTAQSRVPGNSAGNFFIAPLGTATGAPHDFRQLEEFLPPRWARLVDPDQEKIPTALNIHGVVDKEAVMNDVMATLDPRYIWPRISINPHHFQWRAEAYGPEPVGRLAVRPTQFRDIPPLKGHLPRVLENWLHRVTEEPPVPSPEIMYFYLEAWQVAKGLHNCVSESVLCQRQAKRRANRIEQQPSILPEERGGIDVYGMEHFNRTLGKYDKVQETYLQRLEAIPPEFRLVSPDMSASRISKTVGRMVLKGSTLYTRTANRAA